MSTPQTSADTPQLQLEHIHVKICDVKPRGLGGRTPFCHYYSLGPDRTSVHYYDPHGPFWDMHRIESVIGISYYLHVCHCQGRTNNGEGEYYLKIGDNFWSEIDAFLVVYNHKSKKSLVDAERILTEFEQSKETKLNIPIYLVGEFASLGDSEEVALEDAITVAYDHGAWFQQCRSEDFLAVQSVFHKLCAGVLVNRGILTEEQVSTQIAPFSPEVGPAYEDSIDEQQAPKNKHNIFGRMRKLFCG